MDAPADRLGFDKYAEALAELIDNKDTDTPLTVAISAPWGAGKSSLAELLKLRLRQRARDRRSRAPVILFFNAWRHDDAPHLGAAFAADVARSVSRHRPFWLRLVLPLPGAMLGPYERWRRRLLLGFLLAAGALAVATLVPDLRDFLVSDRWSERIRGSTSNKLGSAVVLAAAALALTGKLAGFGRAVGQFVTDPRSEAARGAMDSVADQLGALLKQAARRRRIVIFVDDLERCRPPRAVEVCEVAAQLLAHPNVVTVLLADMDVIAASAEIKYAKLEHAPGAPLEAGSYGRVYLQKLVQIEFALPPADVLDLRELLRGDGELRAVRDESARDAEAERSAAPAMWRITPPVLIAASALGLPLGVFIYGMPTTLADVVVSSIYAFNFGLVIFTVASFARSIPSAVGRVHAAIAKRKLRAVIETIKTETDDPVELERRVLETPEAKKRLGLARQLLQTQLVDDSELRDQAEREILSFLPPYPRSAKRMLNHLRVLLVIASLREMLGGTPALTAAHLGKWVVLTERWPELARALKANPQKLGPVEEAVARYDVDSAVALEELDSALSAGVLPRLGSRDLLRFLVEKPHLGAVLERLVHMAPAPADKPVPASIMA
jgi:KAP family P-loop domain